MNKESFYSIISKGKVEETIRNHPTPLYIYFSEIIKLKHTQLKKCLPKSFRIHYALKANPNGQLLKTMHQFGIGADVASLGK